MSEDRLLADLKAKIGTPEPVRPVRLAPALALGIVGFAVMVVGLLAPLLGLRPDRQTLGDSWLWGCSLLQMAAALPLWWAAVGEALPGRRRSLAALGGAVAVALSCHWLTAWLTHQHSPVDVPAGQAWSVGSICFSLELALGIPMVFWVFWRLRRGLVAEPLRVALAGGLAAGILGDGLWRLFCPFSDPAHILGSHTAGIVGVWLGALCVGWLWRSFRRT